MSRMRARRRIGSALQRTGRPMTVTRSTRRHSASVPVYASVHMCRRALVCMLESARVWVWVCVGVCGCV